MELIAIDFEDEIFDNLCGGFESMVQRPPDGNETEEIWKLTLYLYSFSREVPGYKLSDFFVLSNALTYTGVELGLTGLDTHVTEWAGIYHYEEDYFLINSIENSQGTSLQINLLSSFVYSVPLFLMSREQTEFWEEFLTLYYEVF
jgi:hypothetical protein